MTEKHILKETNLVKAEKVELADAHCHLDMIKDHAVIKDAMEHGLLTMISNGVDTHTNKRTVELCDKRRIFAALGIDPENAMKIGDGDIDDEIEKNVQLIRSNLGVVVAIGEIGLDYSKAKSYDMVAKQKTVFGRFLDVAKSLDLPVSVHSRMAMDDVFAMLKEKEMKKVHLHFFEGNVQQAKEAERLGYMISIPPIESTKRKQVIKDMGIDSLMAESDAPAVGITPLDVQRSVRMIAETKGVKYEKIAEALTLNTKKFFNIHAKLGFAVRA